MNRNKVSNNKKVAHKKFGAKWVMYIAIAAVIISGFLLTNKFFNKSNSVVVGDNLIIPKNEISETAKFYPYTLGDTYMEVIAVKAGDGTIRTALNTCQICYNSGRGYYVQEGSELVCQNCGNRFALEQVEKIKGGCNPVPITEEYKEEDDSNITVSKDFLAGNANYFEKWEKN